MHYSRRDFLKVVAAGLPVAVGAPWFFSDAAHAGEAMGGSYTQAQADRIHDRSTEGEIRRKGENPEGVKARVDRRVRELRTGSIG